MTRREEKRLQQIWQVLWMSNWTKKHHLKLLRRLMKKKDEHRGDSRF